MTIILASCVVWYAAATVCVCPRHISLRTNKKALDLEETCMPSPKCQTNVSKIRPEINVWHRLLGFCSSVEFNQLNAQFNLPFKTMSKLCTISRHSLEVNYDK